MVQFAFPNEPTVKYYNESLWDLSELKRFGKQSFSSASEDSIGKSLVPS